MADTRSTAPRTVYGTGGAVAGLIVLALGGLADVFGLGDATTFGPIQIAAVSIGGASFVAGLAVQLLPTGEDDADA